MICQLPFSGYLCGCGSYIVYNDEVLTSTQIPKERQAEIIRQVRAANAGLLLEGKEDCYRSSHITRFAKLEGTCRYLATLGLTESTISKADFATLTNLSSTPTSRPIPTPCSLLWQKIWI